MINQNTVFPIDGDDGSKSFTTEEQARIAIRTEQLMQEKLADADQFRDLMAGIDSDDYTRYLHRALMNLDAACKLDETAIYAVLHSLTRIQTRVKDEMQEWHESCEEQAMQEVAGEA